MIFLACLLTLVIEVGFFAAVGYRDRYALTVIVCANVITNLVLNLLLWLVLDSSPGWWIYLLEGLVVAAEYAIYAVAFRPGWKLLLLTLAANCLSYGLGLLVFG
ncbi:MAG: hypothetical protein E7427_08245 [Ruminococcaceae bacterium]|nr:hypothetical protein [Oscillospiraceae bacterium]